MMARWNVCGFLLCVSSYQHLGHGSLTRYVRCAPWFWQEDHEMIKQVLIDIFWLLLMYVCMWLALEIVVWVITWQASAMPEGLGR